jgi:hypothetical protein
MPFELKFSQLSIVSREGVYRLIANWLRRRALGIRKTTVSIFVLILWSVLLLSLFRVLITPDKACRWRVW